MYLLLASFARGAGYGRLRFAAAPMVAAGVALGVAASMSPRGSAVKALIPHLENMRFYFAVILLGGAVAMRGCLPPAPAGRALYATSMRVFSWIALPAISFFWLLPESAAAVVAIARRGVLEDREGVFRLAMLGGAAAPALIAAAFETAAARAKAQSAVSLPVTLCALFALKIAGITSWAVGLDPVSTHFMRFVSNIFHDMFHVFFVMYQLPDHPYLKPEAYQGVLYFLSPVTHAVVVSIAATLMILAVRKAFIKRPADEISAIPREPDRRLAKAAFLRANAKAAEIMIVSVILVWSGVMYAQRSQSEAMLDPAPQPVTDDGKGFVIVPLESMMGDTIPSQMRKYSYYAHGRAIVFMTIKKPDRSLAIALDMCMICQPEGYAQIDSRMILCKYCKTPIPVTTVGAPGGCNPIPVTGVIKEEKALRIPRSRLIETYIKGMAGKR